MTTYAVYSRMWSALQLSIFLVSSFFEEILFISFQQKNEIKKGNTPMELKYLLVCSSIDLLDVNDFKEIWQIVNWLENVFYRKFDAAVFMIRGI